MTETEAGEPVNHSVIEIERVLQPKATSIDDSDFRLLGHIAALAIINDDREVWRVFRTSAVNSIYHSGESLPEEHRARLNGMLDVAEHAMQFGFEQIDDDTYSTLTQVSDEIDFKEVEPSGKQLKLESQGFLTIRRLGNQFSVEITPKGEMAMLRFSTKDSKHPVRW